MSMVTTNPLLAPWTGPFGGVPAFDRMRVEDLQPALEGAMAEELAEIEAIAADPDGPTFENTIAALEAAGDALERVYAYFGVWSGNLSSPAFREVQEAMAPRLSEHATRIVQNRPLFQRIAAVYEGPEMERLTPPERRLTKLTFDGFARHGAMLEGEARERFGAINRRLAELHTRFANNVLADEEGHTTFLNGDQLGGLPPAFVRAAARAADEADRAGEYAVANTRSSVDPFLTYSTERDLRERVWRTFYARGDHGDAHDNNAIIAEILRLRHERVQLMGWDSYAAWRLEDRMASTPGRALELLEAVWPAAIARVKEEVADMGAIADAEGAGITIAPWDYRFYAEKVRRRRYDLDSDEVKQYLALDRLRDAMFLVAEEVFGLTFTALPGGQVPVFHPDVRVWEVTGRNDGRHVGLWYLDACARAGKRSGAWATTYRDHETFRGRRTVLASNNSNFIQGADGEPTLVSWDDATTLFHEFGHALHYLTSNVAYPGLNGAVRDFVEFQSQLLERWLLTDRIVADYLVHHETGQPMPGPLVEKLRRAANFNEGFATTEYLACALMDMRYHTTDPAGLDPRTFEPAELAELGMPAEVGMRHRSPHFLHAFSSEGYAAGYYSYLWADVLTADAAEAFREAPDGFFDAEVAERLVTHLFAPQNSVDPAEAYRVFRGRDPRLDALLEDRGFPLPVGEREK